MKILYITDGFCTHDARFIDAIRDQGHEIFYYAQKENTFIPSDYIEEKKLNVNFKLEGERLDQIDLCHIGPLLPNTFSLLDKIKSPKLGVSWGSDVLMSLNNKGHDTGEFKKNLMKVDAFLADCSAVKNKIEALIGDDSRRPIYQFPWGVDVKRVADNKLREKGHSKKKALGWQNKVVFISTRRWETMYGIEELIEAFSRYFEKNADARLILASSGSLKPKILKDIEKKHLANKVFCPGEVDENIIPEWLHAGDVYVSASKCDGSSISLLEAMACEKPVIVHNEHGNLDWVSEGINGWLVNSNEVNSILAGFERAVLHREDWTQIGNSNYQKIIKEANWDKNSLKLTQIYNEILEKK